ncbi:DUF916 domain-containing protein [Furfurilactobacillus entadae]|uniref:DUF916 domain-containing protein n=1 Tax=Furfurilactobacillus entadae TaxID=2922307 RepID=UPI0035E75EE0
MMKQWGKVTTGLMALIIGLMMIGGSQVKAETNGDSPATVVLPQQPSNQHLKNVGYFNLRMKPGQTQTLSMTVINNSNTATTYKVSPNDALTNGNGVITYDKYKPKTGSTGGPTFQDVNQTKPFKVTVPANGKKVVQTKIKMPKKSFDGIILGGITLQQVGDLNTKKTTKQGLTLNNRFTYQMGVVLNEKDTKVDPMVTMGTPELITDDRQAYVEVPLNNKTKNVLSDVTVKATVKRGSKVQQELTTTREHMMMAPQTTMKMKLDAATKTLRPGNYTVKVAVTAENGKYKKTFEERLHVSTMDAIKNAYENDSRRTTWIIALSIFCLLLLGVIGWLIYHIKVGRRK